MSQLRRRPKRPGSRNRRHRRRRPLRRRSRFRRRIWLKNQGFKVILSSKGHLPRQMTMSCVNLSPAIKSSPEIVAVSISFTHTDP